MPDDQKQQFSTEALNKFRQWHFWWLVVFSFLLIISFVYYLPTRFLHQFSTMSDHHVEEEAGHEHAEGEEDHEHENGMMDAEMHEHMDEHMSGGMDMDKMMEHMMKEHGMAEHDAGHMMEEMMSHEHEEGEDHEHVSPPSAGGSGQTDDEHGVSQYHEETDIKDGLVINLNVNPVPYKAGSPLEFNFFVNQKPRNLPVLASQLQVEHEKLMHVVGLRSDMNEYFHIHPDFLADNPSVFSIEYTLNKPGLYKIWSAIKKDGVDHTFGHPQLSVQGDGSKEEKRVFFDRNVVVGNYQVNMAADGTIVKGRDTELVFDIHTLTGQEVTVENYLGAQMHLVFIKDDFGQFIHTHPDGHAHSQAPIIVNTARADEGHEHAAGADEVVNFTVNFPEAGLYKAFAQFRPQGINLPSDEALLAEFWIEVTEKSPSVISEWWGLLLVSALLMAGLSWVVNKYLKVNPAEVQVKK